MATRISKSQQRGHDSLRKALGILENVTHGADGAPWRAIGAVTALVQMALEDLVGEENTEDSLPYAAGAGVAQDWDQLPLWGES